MASSAVQPFIFKDNSGSSNHSIAEPEANEDDHYRQANEDYVHTLPQSPQSSSVQQHKSKSTPPTLSKTLFNLEHYVMIPLLFMLSFFVYYDRGGLSAALNSAQEQLLDDRASQSGAVASCYLFGFCVASPVFALLGARHPPLKMSAIGMFVWCIGAFTTGWPSPSWISHFVWLAGSRLLTGIGEASFLAFAGTIIDIIAPDHARSLWLGTFYMGIPLGYAMGYAVGGTIADMSIYTVHDCDTRGVTECNESWRAIFISEVFLVLPLCALLYCVKQPANMLVIKTAKDELELQRRALEQGVMGPLSLGDEGNAEQIDRRHSEAEPLEDDAAWTKVVRLLCNRSFVLTCLGYALQTFVTGTFAVDAITYLQKVYGWSSGKAGTVFGVLTFVAGVSGSMFGGLVLDKMKAKLPAESPAYKYCKPALRLLVFLDLAAFPFALVAVLWNSVPVFIVGGFLTEFFIFAAAGPVNNVILWSVLYQDRPLASALNTLAIHGLGDALAPLLIGGMVDSLTGSGHDEGHAYNFAFAVATCWLLFSALAFVGSICTMDWLARWMILHGGPRSRDALLDNDAVH